MLTTATPTRYRGIKYRTRLEARWAAFFTHMGWEYTYEPFDIGGYTPTFIVHGARSFFISVAEVLGEEDYLSERNEILDETIGFSFGDIEADYPPVFIVGVTPLPVFTRSMTPDRDFLPVAGHALVTKGSDFHHAVWAIDDYRRRRTGLSYFIDGPDNGCSTVYPSGDFVEADPGRGAALHVIRAAWAKAVNDIQAAAL